jgi:nucleoid-associated protein YgaU
MGRHRSRSYRLLWTALLVASAAFGLYWTLRSGGHPAALHALTQHAPSGLPVQPPRRPLHLVQPPLYTVRPGDNLWSIALRHHVPGGWPALYRLNHWTVGSNPNLIFPGQVLHL